MVAFDVLDHSGSAMASTRRSAQPKPVGRVMQQAVAARLRLEQEREGRVARDADAGDRIHLHGDGQGHGRSCRAVRGRRGQSISSLYAQGAWRGRRRGATKTASPRKVKPDGPRVAREPHASGARNPPPLRRRDRFRGRVEAAAGLHLDEGDRRRPAATMRSISPPETDVAPGEDGIAFEPQQRRREPLGVEAEDMRLASARRPIEGFSGAHRAPPASASARA